VAEFYKEKSGVIKEDEIKGLYEALFEKYVPEKEKQGLKLVIDTY